ncbi:class II aldolase and adducin N-terminal domain-containing protein [Campylobacter concisus]|jgi:L-fuculose-1-phosphate aldolase|uniref:class II aldolase and adducin N-terminal domain-containing protein n=2 Tax=Campylobacter concisus TaxID=199 RepID=UPI000D303238|nr:class II aldolase and adducin N-terminal domain-containing protein [Campylobacter concisus]
MELEHSINEIKTISLSMFRKNFFGVFHGSISARVEKNQFIINKQNAIFDNLKDDDLTLLSSKKDYRWNEASLDADIHLNIYKNINEARFVCYAMPPYATAYAMKHEKIAPKDYFGYMRFNEILVYDPKQYDDWYERAETEIYRYMLEKNTNIIIIKGYGIYAYSRSPQLLAKEIALLENSCKLLHLTSGYSDYSI